MTVRYLQCLLANYNGGLHLFLSGKRKVIGCVQPFRFATLENRWQPSQKTANGTLSRGPV